MEQSTKAIDGRERKGSTVLFTAYLRVFDQNSEADALASNQAEICAANVDFSSQPA